MSFKKEYAEKLISAEAAAKLIKEDDRFRITSYSELAQQVANEGERVVKKSDIKLLREKLNNKFFPVTDPVSLSISDIFLACRDFLLGKEERMETRMKDISFIRRHFCEGRNGGKTGT